MTSFTVQFAYFAVAGMHSNPWYKEIIYPEWGMAERKYWTEKSGLDYSGFKSSWGKDVFGRVFGAGAGDSPRKKFTRFVMKFSKTFL